MNVKSGITYTGRLLPQQATLIRPSNQSGAFRRIGSAVACLAAIIMVFTAGSTAQAQQPVPGLGDFALSAAKFIGHYIQTNGSSSVSMGLTGIGSSHIIAAPVLSESLTLATVGKVGVDTLSFGVEHATMFAPQANKECLGVDINWHCWKLSKAGRILAFNFDDAGLSAGVDAPVEWFGGHGIRMDGLVLRVGAFCHF